LARHAAEKYSREFGWKPALFKSCDRDTGFAELFVEPLREQGVDIAVVSRTEGTTGGGIKIGYGQVNLSLGQKKSEANQSDGPAKNANSPSFCAQTLAQLQRIYVIDEFDLLENADAKRKFADFLKFLSDARPQFKLVITGIADNIQDLVDLHPSTQSNIRKVKLSGMPAQDLKGIVLAGAKLLDLEFEDDAVTSIAQMSEGFARTTHQVARDAALFAVQGGRRTVTLGDVHRAVQRDADLEDKLEDSIRGSNPAAYRDVLIAAARCDLNKLTTREVIASYREYVRGKASDASIRTLIGRLASDDNSRILQRDGEGGYQFADPRMREFIRLLPSRE
jgi:histone H3/H4